LNDLLSPHSGLAAVALAAFLAATLVPLSSEAVLFAWLRLHPGEAHLAIALATFGNTAGGMTSYLLGRLFPARAQAKLDPRAAARIRRWGAAATFFGWLPVAGDALLVAAGWLRLPWLAVLAFSAAGRLARYALIAAL
jgi:membrane protein YqaA with SNARE-associated domain